MKVGKLRKHPNEQIKVTYLCEEAVATIVLAMKTRHSEDLLFASVLIVGGQHQTCRALEANC